MKIWILTISHRHGTDVSAFATEELAMSDLAVYVRTWWQDSGLTSEPSEEDQAAISDYFLSVGDEYYSIDQVDLIGSEQ